MIRFCAFGVRFTLPFLSLLVFPLFHYLGTKGMPASVALSLCAHELGHILAAQLARVEIREIRILPFGGSARMENPYRISPARLLPVAAAGPAANLALMVCTAALAQWKMLSPAAAASVVQASTVLMLFNLLPALPLDGGRMLFCCLQRPLGQERALRIGILLGRILAVSLICGAVLLRIRTGKWNLSFILAALFIFSSEKDERQALLSSHLQSLSSTPVLERRPLPLRLYQLDGQTPASEALRLLRPGESTWLVPTCEGVPQGVLDGRSLVRQIAELGDLPVSSFKFFALFK